MADLAVEPGKIVKRPAGVPLHWCYYLLYGTAVLSALWLHGHPLFSMILLCSVIPAAAVIYVPYTVLSHTIRRWVQVTIVFLSLGWAAFRFTRQVPMDKALIEAVCVLGLSFAFTTRPKDYGYMLVIAVLLLAYGALLPRTLFLIILPCSFIAGLVIMYASRLSSLAGEEGLRAPRGSTRVNWKNIFLHFAAALLLWGYFYSILPTEKNIEKGIFMVSFRTSNHLYIPPAFKKWFTSKKMSLDEKRGTVKVSGNNPLRTSKSGQKVSSDNKAEAMDSSGQGGGTPGTDIVFRAESPLKLYWVGALYDHYDGHKWRASKAFKKQKLRWNAKIWKYTEKIEQKIIIEKWFSKSLYATYRAAYYNAGIKTEGETRSLFYISKLPENTEFPELPFAYTVNSELINQKKTEKTDKVPSLWLERLKRKHYTKLPEKKISARLLRLVNSITRHHETPYQKALALRDYLRNNFKYEQYSRKTPPGRESTDFFVFELKKGHCEYYASALAVMARILKLPARVATGFSPGNYNALHGVFEVHEYHAHAWAQIFIESKGWLTFDAVPPGRIVSKTTPIGIGSMHDPFGDEWKITPPELTESVKRHLNPAGEEIEEDGEKENTVKIKQIKPPVMTRILINIAMAPEKLGKALDKMKERLVPGNRGKEIKFSDIFKALKLNVKILASKFLDGWINLGLWLISVKGAVLWVVAFAVFALFFFMPALHKKYNKLLKLRKCEKWFNEAVDIKREDPLKNIELCYKITRELLTAAGWPRKNNMELFDYGATLKALDGRLCKDTLVVYFIYTKAIYSKEKISIKDSESIYLKMCNIRKFIFKKLGKIK